MEREKMELEEIGSELERLRDAMNCVTAEISLSIDHASSAANRKKEKAEADETLLRLLMGYNALNDAFNVWFDRGSITVNGVRLGRVGNQVGVVAAREA